MKNKIIINSPIISGKTTRILLSFIEEGLKGKSAIYRTAKGDFLSPKVVKNLLKQQKEELLKELKLGKKFTTYSTNPGGKEERDRRKGYNQAVDDLNKKIKKLNKPFWDTNVKRLEDIKD